MTVFSEQLVQPGLLEAVQEKLAGTQMTHSGKKTRSLHHLYITNFLFFSFFLLSFLCVGAFTSAQGVLHC